MANVGVLRFLGRHKQRNTRNVTLHSVRLRGLNVRARCSASYIQTGQGLACLISSARRAAIHPHQCLSQTLIRTHQDTFITSARDCPRGRIHTHSHTPIHIQQTDALTHTQACTSTRAYIRNRIVSFQRMYEKFELRRWAFKGAR